VYSEQRDAGSRACMSVFQSISTENRTREYGGVFLDAYCTDRHVHVSQTIHQVMVRFRFGKSEGAEYARLGRTQLCCRVSLMCPTVSVEIQLLPAPTQHKASTRIQIQWRQASLIEVQDNDSWKRLRSYQAFVSRCSRRLAFVHTLTCYLFIHSRRCKESLQTS